MFQLTARKFPERPRAVRRPAPSNSTAVQGGSLAASIMKAKLQQQANALPDDEKPVQMIQGDQALHEYQQMKREVDHAHRVWQPTGQIPQTRTPSAWIKIMERKLMSAGARYDVSGASSPPMPALLLRIDKHWTGRDSS
jgi:hypothetical protein